jgi:diacylglycerol kinase (ATP)
MKYFLRAFVYATRGVIASFASERNLKVHLAVAIVTIAGGFYFGVTALEWCAIMICIGLVFAFEMINTAIEDLVDLVTTEWNPLAGKIKDAAAGAVLVISIASLVVGLIIFRKYLMV